QGASKRGGWPSGFPAAWRRRPFSGALWGKFARLRGVDATAQSAEIGERIKEAGGGPHHQLAAPINAIHFAHGIEGNAAPHVGMRIFIVVHRIWSDGCRGSAG